MTPYDEDFSPIRIIVSQGDGLRVVVSGNTAGTHFFVHFSDTDAQATISLSRFFNLPDGRYKAMLFAESLIREPSLDIDVASIVGPLPDLP